MAQHEKLPVKIDSDARAHGIEQAFYCGGPGEPYYQPVMECMCGFSTGRCASWQMAGRVFDLHLVLVGAA